MLFILKEKLKFSLTKLRESPGSGGVSAAAARILAAAVSQKRVKFGSRERG